MENETDESVLDYQDEEGVWHVMCACGHTVSGTPRPGDKIALCPNCRFIGSFGREPITIKYPERLPPEGMMSLEGNHPDHVARREIMEEIEAKRAKRRAGRLRRKQRENSQKG